MNLKAESGAGNAVVGEINSPLEFTGNWFIDAGILGFVNLMEEVYGEIWINEWRKEHPEDKDVDFLFVLQERIKRDPEKVYYWYFVLGYMFNSSIANAFHKYEREIKAEITTKQKNMRELIKEKEKVDKEKSDNKDKKIKKIEKKIKKLREDIEKLKIELNNAKNKFKDVKNIFVSQVESFVESTSVKCDVTSIPCLRLIEEIFPDFDIDFTTNNKRLVIFTNNKTSNRYSFRMLANHPNERNFYLFNSDIKNYEALVFLYIYSLLKEDWDVIKLIRAFKSNKKEFVKFLEFCASVKIDPISVVLSVEEELMKGRRKKEVIKKLMMDYPIYENKRDEFEEFVNKIFTNFKGEINRKGAILSFEIFPDSTINPFLYSPGQFPNIGYVNLPSLKELRILLRDLFIPPYLLFLCFFDAFQVISGRNILFYTHNIYASYGINKRIRLMKDINVENQNVFLITWKAIVDYLVEEKAMFNLEDMYVVEVNFEQQKLKNVEYIGISKIKSLLIIDDAIRLRLNKSIPTPWKDKNKKRLWVWLLEEFIKNSSLLPHIVNYVNGLITEEWIGNEKRVGNYILLTSLAIEATIEEMESTKIYGKNLFDEDYFSRYKDVVNDVKQKTSLMNYYGRLLYEIAEEKDEREKIATLLFGKIKTHDKYGFVNVILKYSIGKVENKETKNIVRYLFEHVLHNDISWENYALGLVIGLMKRGDESE